MDERAQEYFQAVERHFIERRGRPLLLSPEDVNRVSRWHETGIPLPAVIEGIDIHFDRMARRGKSLRRAVTLAYVEDDVHDAWAAGKQRRLGAQRAPAEAAPPMAGPETHARFVAVLDEATLRLRSGGETERAVADVVARAAEKLRAKVDLFQPGSADHDEQKVEDHLRRLEKGLLDGVRSSIGHDQLAALEREIDADIEGKRSRMAADTFQRVRAQLVDKKLREAHGIPRLSLFYT